MFLTAAFLSLVSLAPSAPPAPNGIGSRLPALSVPGLTPPRTVPTDLRLQLASPVLGVPSTSDATLARRSRRRAAPAAEAEPVGAPAVNERTPEGATPSSGSGEAAPAVDAAAAMTPPTEAEAAAATEEAPAEDEPSIDLLRQRAALTRIHRPLGIATFGLLTLTIATGTVLAINRPTLFGNGNCAGPEPLFGAEFGCGTMGAIHKVASFVTTGFYFTTGALAIAMPDPENASVGDDARANRLRWHRNLAWVHVVGMILQPILGFLSVNPNLVGVSPANTDFTSAMRTVHVGVGYVTWAALGTGMVLELLP